MSSRIVCQTLGKLFYRKPKSLGAGLTRIVEQAGNSPARIVSATPGERLYSNGVQIYSTNTLNQSSTRAGGIYEYATYVLKRPWKEGVTADSIYAVKGRQTMFSPISDYKVKDGYTIDKVIGNRETMYCVHKNGYKHTEVGDGFIKDLYAYAFL